MTRGKKYDVFERLGVRPLVNAAGNVTTDGGSTVTPSVRRAMEEVGDTWIEIQDLLDATGARVAELLGVEAAYVTAGCYAALTLSTAACISGNTETKLVASAGYNGDEGRSVTAKGAEL